MMIIKDIMYGMIDVPEDYFQNIICYEGFQRLKNISQVSYKRLIPNVYLSRYEHSLGVYYLGKILLEHLQKQKDKFSISIKETFYLACMLHDYGHTPFSHIGEDCFARYIQSKKEVNSSIIEKLLNLIDNSDFTKDMEEILNSRNTMLQVHEIFSVIFSIESYRAFFESKAVDIELFARMILGCCYRKEKKENSLKNIFISFLHGEGIELDFMECAYRGDFFTKKNNSLNDILNVINSIILFEKCGEYHLTVSEEGAFYFFKLCQSYQHESIFFHNNPLVLRDVTVIKDKMNTLYINEPCFFKPEILTNSGIIVNQKKFSYANDEVFNNVICKYKCCMEHESKYELFYKMNPLWNDYEEYENINKINNYNISKCFNEVFNYIRQKFYISFLIIDENIINYLCDENDIIKKNKKIINKLKQYCIACDKQFFFYYVPASCYSINNRFNNDNWLIDTDDGIVESKRFYRSISDSVVSDYKFFYYIYVRQDDGLTIDDWKLFLNIMQNV